MTILKTNQQNHTNMTMEICLSFCFFCFVLFLIALKVIPTDSVLGVTIGLSQYSVWCGQWQLMLTGATLNTAVLKQRHSFRCELPFVTEPNNAVDVLDLESDKDTLLRCHAATTAEGSALTLLIWRQISLICIQITGSFIQLPLFVCVRVCVQMCVCVCVRVLPVWEPSGWSLSALSRSICSCISFCSSSSCLDPSSRKRMIYEQRKHTHTHT